MPLFRNDGSSIHSLVRGSGEPVFLVHGLGCSGADWAFQVAALGLLGMPRAARLFSARLFPEPWQRTLRLHAAAAIGTVPVESYLSAGFALARWAIVDRLEKIKSRILLIAAEHDFTPLAEKIELAAALGAGLAVVRGSRHGTPFDSVDATNACLLAHLTDEALPPEARLIRDTPATTQSLSLVGSIAEERAPSLPPRSRPARPSQPADFPQACRAV